MAKMVSGNLAGVKLSKSERSIFDHCHTVRLSLGLGTYLHPLRSLLIAKCGCVTRERQGENRVALCGHQLNTFQKVKNKTKTQQQHLIKNNYK